RNRFRGSLNHANRKIRNFTGSRKSLQRSRGTSQFLEPVTIHGQNGQTDMNSKNPEIQSDVVCAIKPTCLQHLSRTWLSCFCVAAVALTLAAADTTGQSAEKTASRAVCIDLGKYYTAQLTDSLNSPTAVTENNLASLPKGRQVFLGVPFEVGGVLQLSEKKL